MARNFSTGNVKPELEDCAPRLSWSAVDASAPALAITSGIGARFKLAISTATGGVKVELSPVAGGGCCGLMRVLDSVTQ